MKSLREVRSQFASTVEERIHSEKYFDASSIYIISINLMLRSDRTLPNETKSQMEALSKKFSLFPKVLIF